MKDELKAIGNIGKNVLKATTALFYLPTFMRRNADNDNWQGYGICVGFLQLGGFMIAGKFLDENGLNPFQNSYYITSLGLTLSINALSGLYELYRYEKNKLKNPVITPNSPPSSSGLEEKVETPVVEEPKLEIKTKPLEIFDPWKVEIEELENMAYSQRN